MIVLFGLIGTLFYLQGGKINIRGGKETNELGQEWRDSVEFVVLTISKIAHQETDTDADGIERTNINGGFHWDENEEPHEVDKNVKKKYYFYKDYKGRKHIIK
jgi:hypothetical protein